VTLWQKEITIVSSKVTLDYDAAFGSICKQFTESSSGHFTSPPILNFSSGFVMSCFDCFLGEKFSKSNRIHEKCLLFGWHNTILVEVMFDQGLFGFFLFDLFLLFLLSFQMEHKRFGLTILLFGLRPNVVVMKH
jgi:hypothetical protein